jgi:hypothetical protein
MPYRVGVQTELGEWAFVKRMPALAMLSMFGVFTGEVGLYERISPMPMSSARMYTILGIGWANTPPRGASAMHASNRIVPIRPILTIVEKPAKRRMN